MCDMVSGAYQSVLIPGDTSLLVGVGVGVALGRTGLTAEETVQVGADLVATVSLNGVALSATSLDAMLVYCPVRANVILRRRAITTHLEELGTLGGVT